MSWPQPPGYVHQVRPLLHLARQPSYYCGPHFTFLVRQMIHESWLPDAVAVETQLALSVSAQRAADGSKLRLLLVNSGGGEVTAAVDIDGMDTDPAVTLTTLSAADPSAANPPGQPTLVSPSTKHATLRPGTDTLTLPPYSFTVVLFDKA